jgi:hypothetical protein
MCYNRTLLAPSVLSGFSLTSKFGGLYILQSRTVSSLTEGMVKVNASRGSMVAPPENEWLYGN